MLPFAEVHHFKLRMDILIRKGNNVPVSKMRVVQLLPNASCLLPFNIFILFLSKLAYVFSESETQHSSILTHQSKVIVLFNTDMYCLQMQLFFRSNWKWLLHVKWQYMLLPHGGTKEIEIDTYNWKM